MKLITNLCALAGLGMITFASGDARADASAACTPTYISWNDGFGGQFSMICGGGSYYARVSPGCTTGHSVETQKIWMSMAQTAYLSGNKITILYNTTCGINLVDGVALVK